MSDWLTVLVNIATMCLVILVGWFASRRGYLWPAATTALSRFVVDIAIPALILTQLLATVDGPTLRAEWPVPVLGGLVLLIGAAVGAAAMAPFSSPGQRGTFVFLVMISNWVYLPLPIAQALYGSVGVRTVLLFNVGALVVQWLVGVRILQGGRPAWRDLIEVVRNPGVIATAAGITLALVAPGLRSYAVADAPLHAGWAGVGDPLFRALHFLAALTIPLALVLTGAQLGQLKLSAHPWDRGLAGVGLSRLLIAPAVCLLVLLACRSLLDSRVLAVVFLIAAMPVAVGASIFAERFGGDVSLAARSVFYTTLASMVTVPGFFLLFGRLVG